MSEFPAKVGIHVVLLQPDHHLFHFLNKSYLLQKKQLSDFPLNSEAAAKWEVSHLSSTSLVHEDAFEAFSSS